MSDLISKKALIKAILIERDKYPLEVEERYSFGVKVPCKFNQALRGGIRKCLNLIENAPTIDAESVRHGYWIKPTVIDGRAFNIPHCSVCNEVPCGVDEHTNYCPHCGAKMDGGSNEE